MAGLWNALDEAAKPQTALHIASSRDGAIPLERLLTDAEWTAAQIAQRCPQGHEQRRLGLLLANGEPWIRGLLATLRLDGVAVPLSLPTSMSGLDAHVQHIRRIIEAAGLDAILVDRTVTRLAGRVRETLPQVAQLDITEVADGGPWCEPLHEDAGALAVVQYTSGSTSVPRGVTLTHGNILAGISTIVAAIEYTEDDRLGTWLPLFHDMGLFSVLTSFLTSAPVWLWRPSDFIRDPISWLTRFAEVRATTNPAPNFAFDYLADVAQGGVPDGLDLSAWRLALNGAEPVRAHTLEKFHRTFAPYGLPQTMMSSCYGLAEATLMVTFADLRTVPRTVHIDRFAVGDGSPVRLVPAGDTTARDVVSVGPAAPGIGVRVGEHDTDGVVGEIQVRGPAVTRGYSDIAAQEQPFTADGWLKTADLGFRHGGEYFIVGRTKNMIVIRGQNYYAEDIEELVRRAAGPAALRCAAFHDSDEVESMAILLELLISDPDDVAELVSTVEKAVTLQLGGTAIRVHPVPPRSIPLTTSGKVKRDALRAPRQSA